MEYLTPHSIFYKSNNLGRHISFNFWPHEYPNEAYLQKWPVLLGGSSFRTQMKIFKVELWISNTHVRMCSGWKFLLILKIKHEHLFKSWFLCRRCDVWSESNQTPSRADTTFFLFQKLCLLFLIQIFIMILLKAALTQSLQWIELWTDKSLSCSCVFFNLDCANAEPKHRWVDTASAGPKSFLKIHTLA